MKGAGITGRRCDQCVSPLAEMTSKGNECRQLSSNECPKAFAYNIWWPRTAFNSIANASCPKGSIGTAFRTCVENTGWLNDVDLSDCKSLRLIDSQLFKWSQELNANKSQLNSYQAFKLVEDLNRVTMEADDDDDLSQIDEQSSSNSFLSTSANSLYAHDLLVVRNLTEQILKYEIENAPSFLFIQDKYFLTNLFSTLNRILGKRYELKLYQLTKRLEESSKVGAAAASHNQLTEILILLDKYIKVIVENNQENSLSDDDLELNLANFQLYLKTMQSQSFADSISNVKFKLLTTQAGAQKVSFVSLNGASCNFPNSLIYTNGNSKTKKYSYSAQNFQVVSNIFILNAQQSSLNTQASSTMAPSTTSSSNQGQSFYVVIDFVLTNNYDTNFDTQSNTISYRGIKAAKADYKCVYLNHELKVWSSQGAKLISFDSLTNTVKCSYDHFSVYAVITPTGSYVKASSIPVNFSVVFYSLLPIALFIILLTVLALMFLRRFKTALTVIYSNLAVNVLLMQIIFFIGVNGNSSQISCKFISILQHYFHLSSYLWLFLVSLHLYRMLTELRDINKLGSAPPVFYYVIAYVTPTIMVGLTLGIKQDIYSNYDSISGTYPLSQHDLASVYCWLNMSSYNEVFIVFFLPITAIVFAFLVLTILSFKESKQSTFKQTDISLVQHSLILSIILLPFKCLVTIFLVLFLNASTCVYQSNANESSIYQYLYLSMSIVYSIVIFFAFVLFNKYTKSQLAKAWSSFKNSSLLNDSLNASKSKLTNKLQYINEPFTFGNMHQKQIIDKQKIDFENNNNNNYQINSNLKIEPNSINKFVLDFHDFQNHTNSVSTTTTSGTLENTDELNSQDSEYLKQGGLIMGVGSSSNGYMSNLANTTNTESTTNDSEFNYHFDFNRPQIPNEIRECDVVDVGKILKSRNYLISTSPESQSQEQIINKKNEEDIYNNRNVFVKSQYYAGKFN